MSILAQRLWLFVVLAALVGAGYLVLRNAVILPGYRDLERSQAIADVARCKNAIRREARAMGMLAADWANRDETYCFARTGDPDYVARNLRPEYVAGGLDTNLVYVLDKRGQVVWGETYDPDSPVHASITGLSLQDLEREYFFLAFADMGDRKEGIIRTPKGIMVVGSAPIRFSDGTGLPAGVMVMGRLVDSRRLEVLRDQTQLDFRLQPVPGRGLDPQGPYAALDSKPFLAMEEPGSLAVFAVINDIEGRDVVLARIDVPRLIMAQGLFAARLVGLGMAALGLAVLAGGWLLLDRNAALRRRAAEIKALADRVALECREREEVGQALRQSEDANRRELQGQVRERTAELSRTVQRLSREAAERERAEQGLLDSQKRAAGLYRISSAINAARNLDEMFGVLHASLMEVMNASNMFIALVNAQRDCLEFIYFRDEVDQWLPSILRISETETSSPTLEVIRQARPMLMRKPEAETMVREKGLHVYGTVAEAWLGVPLRFHDSVVGAMVVQDYHDPEAYGEKDVELLVAVSEQVAMAVQRSQAEQRIIQAKEVAEAATRMMSEFVATVSHEMRTPMTSILGFSQLLRKDLRVLLPGQGNGPEGPDVRRRAGRVDANLDIVISESRRLTDLINDVLDLAKLESQERWDMRPVAVAPLARHAADLVGPLFQDRPVYLRLSLDEDLPEAACEPERIIQVFVNLLSNAAKFTTHGEVTCAVRAVDGMIQAQVTDTGPGIEAGDLERIFEKFVQARGVLTDKPRGTGLGLAICREIVGRHNGRIWAESEPGRGSAFYFTIPLAGPGA